MRVSSVHFVFDCRQWAEVLEHSDPTKCNCSGAAKDYYQQTISTRASLKHLRDALEAGVRSDLHGRIALPFIDTWKPCWRSSFW
jgi:hypothetical protein